MSNTELWLVNTHSKVISIPLLDMNPPRIQDFHPGRPVPLPRSIALKHLNQWRTIKVIDDPKPYLQEKNYHQLIIRDSGMGDLLLLEPSLRAIAETGKDVSLMTKFIEIYKWHPNIKSLLGPMETINDIEHDPKNYDHVSDLRWASEKHDRRGDMHRSDIYSTLLNVVPADKQPRLYWKLGRAPIKRDKAMRFIGFSWNAQDTYRRYPRPRAISVMQYFLQQDSNVRLVMLGHEKYFDFKHKQVIDLQGKTDRNEIIDTIANLDVFIGVDSGLSHAALTMHIPSVVHFGKMNPDLRVRYYTGPREIITKDIQCRPCSDRQDIGCKHGDAMKDWNYTEPNCFMAPCTDIPPKEFYDAYKRLPKVEKPLVYEPGNLLI